MFSLHKRTVIWMFVASVLLAGLYAPRAAAQQGAIYSVTDLGSFGGNYQGTIAQPFGINDKGQVVGFSANPAGYPTAFLYSTHNGTPSLLDLGTLGGTSSGAAAINNAGQVVGVSNNSTGTDLPFLYSGGAMTQLPIPLVPPTPPPGVATTTAAPNAINDSGQISGWSLVAISGNPDYQGSTHAVLWNGGNEIDLGLLPGAGANQFNVPPISYARGINNSGQVVGYATSGSGASVSQHAFLHSGGTMQDLGTLPGDIGSAAVAINNGGQIVGASSPAAAQNRAFLYDPKKGGMTPLPTIPGESNYGYDPQAINDRGTVVGFTESPTAQLHAFIYSMGRITDLNTLISPGLGITLTEAAGINNSGQIVASGTIGGISHAYLLTPCVIFNAQVTTIHNPNTFGSALNEMTGTFTPSSGATIPVAADGCGFIGFNFRQEITNRPCPSPPSPTPTDHDALPPDNYCTGATTGLTAPPAFPDPPRGAYTNSPAGYDPYPYYFNWKPYLGATTNLYFYDTPADVCFPTLDPFTIQKQMTQCGGVVLPGPLQYQSFTTSLVGMIGGTDPPTPSAPLCSWTWQSTYLGTALGGGSITYFSTPEGFCTPQQ